MACLYASLALHSAIVMKRVPSWTAA